MNWSDHRRVLAEMIEVWALVGDVDGAQSIAHYFPEEDDQSQMLVKLAGLLASRGNRDRALALLDYAQAIARSMPDRRGRVNELTELAKAAASAGDLGLAKRLVVRAEAIAYHIDSQWAMDFLSDLATSALAAGEVSSAKYFAHRITTGGYMVVRNPLGSAVDVVASTERLYQYIIIRNLKQQVDRLIFLGPLASALAAKGRFRRAKRLANRIDDPVIKATTFADLARQASSAGRMSMSRTFTRIARTVASTVRISRGDRSRNMLI